MEDAVNHKNFPFRLNSSSLRFPRVKKFTQLCEMSCKFRRLFLTLQAVKQFISKITGKKRDTLVIISKHRETALAKNRWCPESEVRMISACHSSFIARPVLQGMESPFQIIVHKRTLSNYAAFIFTGHRLGLNRLTLL